MGFAFSTMARTQMQAQQLAQFGLLPSMMLSGFMQAIRRDRATGLLTGAADPGRDGYAAGL